MAEKLTYGIKNVHYAKVSVSESGAVTFGTPKPLPGASEIALSTVGDPVKVYADNVTYEKFHVNQGYDGNLSVYNIPDAFARDHLGMYIDSNGVLVESADATQDDFALMFEFNTNTSKTKRTLLYSVSAGRTEINGKTKEESIDPEALSIPLTASPDATTGYVKASIVGDANDPAWASWFSSVYTPASTMQYQVTVTVSGTSGVLPDALVVCGGKFAQTDSNGKATFMLPNGTYDVLLSADGHTAKTDTVTVASAAISKAVTMEAA